MTCDECGWEYGSLDLREHAARFVDAFDGSKVRPAPEVWSPLEYACHVRDVHELFAERVRLILDEDVPTFANWDQDATALERDYGHQDPAEVVVGLIEAAGTVAGIYASVPDEARGRRGVRSNGDQFTVESLGSYHLHDVVHHLHDVGAG